MIQNCFQIFHLHFTSPNYFLKQANYELQETLLTSGSSMEFYFTWPLLTPGALTYSSGAASYEERADMRFISEHKK